MAQEQPKTPQTPPFLSTKLSAPQPESDPLPRVWGAIKLAAQPGDAQTLPPTQEVAPPGFAFASRHGDRGMPSAKPHAAISKP
jgi:hypothetical protein